MINSQTGDFGIDPLAVDSEQQSTWMGQSREQYTYIVRCWPGRPIRGPGNFIFTRSTGHRHGWIPVLIGECENLSALNDHVLHRAGPDRFIVSHIHYRLNLDPVSRQREVADLVELWIPAANAAVTDTRSSATLAREFDRECLSLSGRYGSTPLR